MSKSIAPKLARIVHSDPMLTTVLEYIGPKLARDYLETNLINRRVRQSWVNTLAQMMAAGDWKLTHQGISFDINGRLRDGQHRLLAIIKSGVTVPMLVTRGLQPEVLEVIDIHQRRTDSDAALLLGLEIGTQAIAIAKRMHESIYTNDDRRMTRPEVLRFVQRHYEAIRFAQRGIHGKYFGHASVRAPIARAFYTADRERLEHYLQCLLSGRISDDSDLAAITFRTVILRDHRMFGGGTQARIILYRKAEYALMNFLKGKPTTRIFEISNEEFPLPEETEG